MNIRFLETAIWLAELRNFRVTAERMNMTPAAISNRITAMEQELGFKLFDRDARDVRLTVEGATFVDGAREIVARYNALVGSLTPEGTLDGTVRIGLVPGMAMTLLPIIVDTLRKRFPRIRVSLTTDATLTILKKLEDREVDVCLGRAQMSRDHHRIVNLCTFGMYWVANSTSVDSTVEETLSKRELAQYPIISYEMGTHNHTHLLEYFAEYNLRESIVHYSNALGTTISMVSAGIGISVLPPVLIQNELRAGSLRVLRVQPGFPAAEYAAIYLETASSRLSSLVASIACDAATDFCNLYDDSLAMRAS
jgi:DNA-binding transcriptional LysR family regulator